MNYIATVFSCIFNHEAYVKKMLKSVLEQETKYPFKFIILDDCSTDRSREIIDKFLENNQPSSRIEIVKIYNPVNQGLMKNVEMLFSTIDTKYTLSLGGDDYWIDNHKIEKEIDYMEKHPEVSYIHTGFQIFDEKTGAINTLDFWEWNKPADRRKQVVDFFVDGPSYFANPASDCIKTSIYHDGLLKYRPLLHSYVIGEGTFRWVSLLMLGGNIAYLPDVTTSYTKREKSLSHHTSNEDFFRFRSNYYRTQIEAFHLIGLKPTKEYYHAYYWLSHLLDISKSHSTLKKEFDALINVVNKELPLFYEFYFKLCNRFYYLYLFNLRLRSYITSKRRNKLNQLRPKGY